MRSNNLFKALDFCVGAVLLPVARYYKMFPKAPPSVLTPQKVLVVKLCCFGDALLSLLSLQSLRKRHPSATITVLCSQRTAPIFERCVFIHQVIALPVSGTSGIREFLRVFRLFGVFITLLRGRFDVLLDYDVYYRFTTILGLFCGKAYSAGFETFPGRASFYHRKSPRPKDAPEWKLFYDMLEPFNVEEADRLEIVFRLNRGEEGMVREMLTAVPAGTLRVGVMMGGSPNWPEKRWPVSHFADFMKRLNGARAVSYFLFGLPVERDLARELTTRYGIRNVTDLTGRTPFPVLYGILRELDLFVSNDTGPMHLAALAGTRTLGIFGPTSEEKWSPPGRFTAVHAENCARRPCYYLSHMPFCADRQCLFGLTPDAVFSQAMRLMEGN